MNCSKVRRQLPGYLDGAATQSQAAQMRQHLESCAACRSELERYRRLSLLMSRADRAQPPADLAVRIRIAVAQARPAEGWREQLSKWADRLALMLDNILKPLALPATGGLVAALVVFAVTARLIAAGVPIGGQPNDLPIHLMQPARLESLAPFPMPGAAESESGVAGEHSLVVEATVNAQGEVVNYQILYGPRGLAVRRQLDQVLFFSRFRPQMSFGRPIPGGRVVLSFSEIRVRG